MFAVEADALALAVEEVEQERRDVLARDAGRCSGGQAGGEQPVVQRRGRAARPRAAGWPRPGRAEPSPALRGRACTAATSAAVSTRQSTAMPGVAQVEAGEAVGAVAEHGDAEGLQPLQGGADVEDRLHAGADDGDRQRGRARAGRPTRPRCRGPRGARRRGRRWRTRRCRPARRGGPSPRRSSRPWPRARCDGRQVARTHLDDVVAAARSASSASSSSPMRARARRRARSSPAPRRAARTASSISRATRRLSGRGRPWLMIVDSSATTGRPAASASATSGWTCQASGTLAPSPSDERASRYRRHRYAVTRRGLQARSQVPTPRTGRPTSCCATAAPPTCGRSGPTTPTGCAGSTRRLSDETIYFRFFAPLPELSDKDVSEFTNVDHVDRVALVATVGEEIDRRRPLRPDRRPRWPRSRSSSRTATRAAVSGRSSWSTSPPPRASAGCARFVADVLPTNRRMLAGLHATPATSSSHEIDDGVVPPRVQTSSRPRTPAPSRSTASTGPRRVGRAGCCTRRRSSWSAPAAHPARSGRVLLQHIVDGRLRRAGLRGQPARHRRRGSSACRRTPRRSTSRVTVDLAVVAVPGRPMSRPSSPRRRPRGCTASSWCPRGSPRRARRGATSSDDWYARRAAPACAWSGPTAFGLLDTDPDGVAERVAVTGHARPRGRIGFFASPARSASPCSTTRSARGLGISTFVSAGNRADVSGNDLMQFWEDDPATDVVLLYLESHRQPAQVQPDRPPAVADASRSWP